jgi:hypothetical protein
MSTYWPVSELTPVHKAYELASFQEPVTANLINFDPKEDTAYEGSQAEGSRVALIKTEMDAMSFNKRQELIKELAGEEGKDFHLA